MAAALNMMASAPFGHSSHSHSRSNSVSSHSSLSRPTSAHGPPFEISQDDIYSNSYGLQESSPSHLKSQLRASQIRAARTAASPYPRDTDSVHSSSSEADDMASFLNMPHTGGGGPSDYHTIYPAAQTMNHEQGVHAAGAFGRMSLSPDQGLDKLAMNVRAATTTSASDRAKQIFVQAWLTANYAPYPDGNVPRQGLYFSYRRVCDAHSIPHINTATLGKAIRLCFPTIKTRRLGVRGNSKYHYCGIRPATSQEAEWLQDYIQKSNNSAAQNSINAQRAAQEQSEGGRDDGSDGDEDDDSEGVSSAPGSKRNSLSLGGADTKGPGFTHDLSEKTPTVAATLSHQAAQRPPNSFPPQASIRRHPGQEQGLPPGVVPSAAHSPSAANNMASYIPPQHAMSVRQFPHFPSIDDAVGAGSTTTQSMAAREVWGWFTDHLDVLLDSVRNFHFDNVEMNLRAFWTSLSGSHREVVHAPAIAGLMAKADAIVYDEILEILRQHMLTTIPPPTLGSLRQLANKMEKVLLVALENYGNTFVEPKVELGARFGHLVLRFLDIYQVTQALTAVLTNQKQLAEMRRSWTKVDFESVRNQSALVCNCRHEDLVHLLEYEFPQLMETVGQTAEPVREVMAWADKCCDRLMGGRGHGADERNTMSSRSVLIRWGYVTSQVMRDLTIRSDPAFGAFQIFKLFLDDWIAVNVLRSVALSTNSVAASVQPMMQQQHQQLFTAASPMPGQESFPTHSTSHPPAPLAHTPTTSSMLAALQSDSYSTTMDPAAFGGDTYSLSYMDASGTPDDALSSVHQTGLVFPDFTGGSAFDVSGFTPEDLGMTNAPTPAGGDLDGSGSHLTDGDVKREITV